MYVYPYGDSQQLNLDWIINKLKELEASGLGGLTLQQISEVFIALTYSTSTQYRRYDYCFKNGKLYRALNDNIGAWADADWLEVRLGDDIPVLTRLINAIDAAAVVDVKFDTSGTNGKLQQKYNNAYHDVVEVDYTPVQYSKKPLSSNAGYELNATAVFDVKFDTSGTNGKLQQKYNNAYHDVVEVDYTPVQYSKKPLSSNAGYDLNNAISNVANDVSNLQNTLGTPETITLNASTMTFDSGVSLYNAAQNFIYRVGKVCILSFSIKLEGIVSTAAKDIINYFPIGWRPNNSYPLYSETGLGDGKLQGCRIMYTDGLFRVFPVNTGTSYAIGSCSYICE